MKLNIRLFVNVCHLINSIGIIRSETHHWQYIFRRTQFTISWLLLLCSIFIFSRNFFYIYLASDTATAENRSTRNVKAFTPTLFYQFPSDSVPKTFKNRQQYLQFCKQGYQIASLTFITISSPRHRINKSVIAVCIKSFTRCLDRVDIFAISSSQAYYQSLFSIIIILIESINNWVFVSLNSR